eukprot:TRINITY_DN4122_c0_g1_i1.p1 TRINITY_DN4122_c0_g1~~TRINITY_DN4122_c0_g1_i1.p1  ORF type:complete len:238 (-),score=65.01 TRINITY_DN4122_c0_g1_i1:48-761(-)
MDKSLAFFVLLIAFIGLTLGSEYDININEDDDVGGIGGDGPVQAKYYINYIRDNIMPCLKNYTIEVVNYDDPGYFLRSSVKYVTAVRPPLKRTYQMFVNPQLFNSSYGPTNKTAMESIIMHEMNHILDYTHMSSAKLAEFGLKYVSNYSFLITYEHETDWRVMRNGYGEGLIKYREWIYSVLSGENLEKKRIEYYTPAEIRVWMDNNPNSDFSPCTDYDEYLSYVCNVCRYNATDIF